MALTARTVSSHLTDYDKVKSLYEQAFPPEELVKWSRLMRKSHSQHAEFLAYYDQNQFVGFSYVIQQPKINFLFYLAVHDQFRSQGYGGRILNWLQAKYEDTPLVLEAEALDDQADNREQRERRFRFYQTHGFNDSAHTVLEDQVKYSILSNTDFEMKDLEKAYHWFWRPFFHRQNITFK